MAISDQMSAPNDWTMQFYHQIFSAQAPVSPGQAGSGPGVFTDRVSDSTIVTTTVASGPVGPGNHSNSSHLTPEGGVSKPSRRRSRASRRTPTTIMNTDTTNFRAMVQQFTGGGPNTPFAPDPARGMLNFGFGLELGSTSGGVNPTGPMMAPSGSFHLLQPPQQQRFHQNELQNMLSADPRLGNYLRGTNVEGSQAHPRPSSSSSDDRNNSNSTYNMF